MRLDHLLSKEQLPAGRSSSGWFLAARSVPECGAAGAQGWNIDLDIRGLPGRLSTSRHASPFGGWCGGSGTGDGGGWWVSLARCWVLKDRADTHALLTGGGLLMGVSPYGRVWCWAVSSGLVGCAEAGRLSGGGVVPVVF